MTLDRVEFDLKQFLQQYQTIKKTLENDLDVLERDIANIERSTTIKVRSSPLYSSLLFFSFSHDISIWYRRIIN